MLVKEEGNTLGGTSALRNHLKSKHGETFAQHTTYTVLQKWRENNAGKICMHKYMWHRETSKKYILTIFIFKIN